MRYVVTIRDFLGHRPSQWERVRLGSGYRLQRLLPYVVKRDVHCLQHPRRDAVALADEAEQDVLGSHTELSQTLCLFDGIRQL